MPATPFAARENISLGLQLRGRSFPWCIFALGAVLYEMTTGKRAFKGKTTASVIAAVLAAEPQPISAIQPM